MIITERLQTDAEWKKRHKNIISIERKKGKAKKKRRKKIQHG